MIQINIKTNNSINQQFDKVTEEFEEVRFAIESSEKYGYTLTHLNTDIVEEFST